MATLANAIGRPPPVPKAPLHGQPRPNLPNSYELRVVTTTTGIAWAVPVEITELGVHLQAYQDLLPTIHQLRLCKRFGQGPKAYITRLPVELCLIIESILMTDKRAEMRPEWEGDFECFEARCEPIQHMTRKEFLNEYGGDGCLSDDHNHSEGEFCVNACREVNLDIALDAYDQHERYAWRWRQKVGSLLPTKPENFSTLQKMLFSQLGMYVFAGHITRQNTPGMENTWREAGVESMSTAAFLCTPVRFALRQSVQHDMFSGGNVIQDIFATPLEDAQQPPENEQRRFKRAMDLLGLRPSADEIRAAFPEPGIPGEELKQSSEWQDATWPKRMILTRLG